MQVTHNATNITHAVLGKAVSQDFGISDSPEFFHILSSSLYSNQRLAMVRETLCNAWDAHIDAGKSHLPIHITLTKDKLIIRDFGKGIHPDMMGPLYCTYGGTNKKNDGRQTGGFGLGCKSPFAYTDHFQTISHHEGTKSIYNLSKSSAQLSGKPSISLILSLPTTESGIELTIPIQQTDLLTLQEHIYNVVFAGEIKATFNDSEMPILPLSECTEGWIVTNQLNSNAYKNIIHLRYGNVVYPVPDHPEYGVYMIKIHNFLSRALVSSKYKIVFFADPDTVAVTPSRETLSLQEQTFETIKTLLENFVETVILKADSYSQIYLNELTAKMKAEKNIGQLLNYAAEYPGTINVGSNYRSSQVETSEFIIKSETLLQCYAYHNYPDNVAFRKRDLLQRLVSAQEITTERKGDLPFFTKLVAKNFNKMTSKTQKAAKAWYNRKYVRVFARDLNEKLSKNENLSFKRMFVYDRNYSYSNGSNWNNESARGLFPVQKYLFNSVVEYTPILRNIVLLVHSIKDIQYDFNFKKFYETFGSVNGVFAYQCTYSQKSVNAAREYFETKGFTILDMTANLTKHKEQVALKKAESKKPRRAKQAGYASIAGCRHPSKSGIRVDWCFNEGQPRIQNPEFYEKVLPSKADTRSFSLGSFDYRTSVIILNLFGDKGAVISSHNKNPFADSVLPELTTYVVDTICKFVTTDPNILAYLSESVEYHRQTPYSDPDDSVINLMFRHSEIRSIFGLTVNLNQKEYDRLRIFFYLKATQKNWVFTPENKATIAAAVTSLSTIKPCAVVQQVIKDIDTSTLVTLFTNEFIHKLLKTTQPDPNKIKALGLMLQQSLKG